ncbi:MAG TPA: hypothetical protein VGD64_04445, partial [Acidisarcina sp.]
KSHVLGALGKAATEMRSKLGESLSTLQRYDTPLAEATTPSLEALKALTSGRKILLNGGPAAATPFFKHAIDLDPNFALAYAYLGRVSSDVGESGNAVTYTSKAYELRDRASEFERYFITASYHMVVTGDLNKAEQTCQLWIQAYPRAELPHDFLSGIIYPSLGQLENAKEHGRIAIDLAPDNPISYDILAFAFLSVDQVEEAAAAEAAAQKRNLEWPGMHSTLYQIAFQRGDALGMAKQVEWSAGKPGVEDGLLDYEAATAAYTGHLAKARELTRQAIASARAADERETAAGYESEAALREALFGNLPQARDLLATQLPRSYDRGVHYTNELALAFSGDAIHAQVLAEDQARQFPEDTLVHFYYSPTVEAQIAISRNQPDQALKILQDVSAYDFALMGPAAFQQPLFPVYVRGEAYLAAGRGREAAAEFQKMLDHRGMLFNIPLGPLAHLGLGRAYAMQGDTAKARAAYQDFFSMWKDADPDIPVLLAAKAEFAKLK